MLFSQGCGILPQVTEVATFPVTVRGGVTGNMFLAQAGYGMQQFSKVLILEDRREDADLLEREAARSLPGAEFSRVALKAEFTTALRELKPDLILTVGELTRTGGSGWIQRLMSKVT